MRITKLILATTLILSTSSVYAEEDRFDEYAVMARQVPHERLRSWPIGDKVGLELLVKRGTTDEQLAKVVRWYVSVGATYIIIYDNRADTREGGGDSSGFIASYSAGKLSRFIYRHGDLVDERPIDLSPQKKPNEANAAKQP